MDKCMIWAGEGGEACWWEANCGSFPPPFGWGGNVLLFPPIMGGQYINPPFFETLGGEFFVPPPSGFSWGGGEIFSWGETPNGGKKASMTC